MWTPRSHSSEMFAACAETSAESGGDRGCDCVEILVQCAHVLGSVHAALFRKDEK
jgi:hypothetical protein